MLRRTSSSDSWQSVAGSLEWDESPKQAAHRELYEETGLMAGNALIDFCCQEKFPILSAWCSHYMASVHVNTEHWFALRVPGRRQAKLHADEHAEYRRLPYA